MSKKENTEWNGQYVLVTTQHKGVFAGFLEKEMDNGNTVVLKDCRCAIYWGTTRGLWQFATEGPNPKSKIGDPAPVLRLRDVTSVSLVSSEAAAAWKTWKNS